MENNLVKNNSNGYGYNYASLSDIAKQGYTIPKMKVVNVGDVDYVFYLDEKGEWQQGARVVVPSSKSMNDAQLYGSALTYARRYTTLLALGLSCDDDVAIESIDKEGATKEIKKATKEQVQKISELYDVVNITKMLQFFKIEKLEDLTFDNAKVVIAKKVKENENNQ